MRSHRFSKPAAVGQQFSELDLKVMRLARHDAQVTPVSMAMVSSTDFVRASERPTAISTLSRQRHLTHIDWKATLRK